MAHDAFQAGPQLAAGAHKGRAVAVKGIGSIKVKLKNIAKSYESNKQVRAGFLEGATYPDGTPVALVAAVHEFGAPAKGIPVRPFMRTAIAQNKGKWADQLSRAIVESGTAEAALGMVGESIKDDLRSSIRDGDWAPNKPRTVARKGFAKPLIDTAHMINSVAHEVVEK